MYSQFMMHGQKNIMVKFSEVRKTSEASKYVSYWREFGGVKAASDVVGGSYLVGLL